MRIPQIGKPPDAASRMSLTRLRLRISACNWGLDPELRHGPRYGGWPTTGEGALVCGGDW